MLEHKSQEILIKSRRNIFTNIAGGNPSLFSGTGLDFSELREYNIGDDIRSINWKVTASQQTPYVNVFNEERELNILCVFVLNSTIYFGTKRFKQEVMSEILSLISYSTLKNNDRLSTMIFSNKEEFYHPPTRSRGSLNITIPASLSLDPRDKKCDYKAMVEQIRKRSKKRSLIFIIGDFYGEDIDLSALARNEVYPIIVRDHFEQKPSLYTEIGLLDTYNNKVSNVNITPSLVLKYEKVLQSRDAKLHEHFISYGMRAVKIYTDEEPFVKLSALFRRQ